MNQSAAIYRFSQSVRRQLDRIEPPDSFVLVGTAMIVGAGTGFGAVLFVRLLSQMDRLVNWIVNDFFPGVNSALPVLLIMILAGLTVGYMVNRWAKEAKGHGVPEVMEAIALRGGRIRPRVAFIKVLASSITIGSGGSAGREGPIVQVGSALGSTLGQLLRLSEDRVRTLVACGAAAGIAATFNAPIAGTIFALEVILGRFTTRYFGAVVISSVSSAIVGRAFLGDQPAFSVPAYTLNNLWEIFIYMTLAILAALVAVAFIRFLYRLEGIFEHWSLHPAYKAAIGMALTGLVAMLLPERQVLGPGLEFIGETIAEDFSMSLQLMAALLVLKLLATSFTLGSGNSGGVFAPALFMGAVLGGIVGNVAAAIWPDVVIHPGAYAIVGMAAVFASAARAPITAVIIVFEMSNDYKLILPLMMTTVLATLLTEYLFSESIYTLKLKLKGISLQHGRDLDLMQNLLVREAMNHTPYVVEAILPLEKLGAYLQETHAHSFPVVDQKHNLVGMVSISDYEMAMEQENYKEYTVADVATMDNLLFAYEDEPLSDALQRIAVREVNKLPVVTRQEPQKIIGVIRRRDIIKAYKIALSRRASGETLPVMYSSRRQSDTEFLEVQLSADSPAVNQSLLSLSDRLPHDCVIVSIHRHGSVLIPHGDTVLQDGDLLNIFLKRHDESSLRNCLLGKPVSSLAK